MTENKQEYPGFDSKTAHNKPDQFREVPLRARKFRFSTPRPLRNALVALGLLAVAATVASSEDAAKLVFANFDQSPQPLKPQAQSVPGAWYPDTPMPEARYDFGSTFSEDRKNFYLSGGATWTNNFWKYDTQTSVWSVLKNTPLGKQGSAMASLNNSELFEVNGIHFIPDIGPTVTNKTWVYNIQSNTWTEKAPTNFPSYNHSLVKTELGEIIKTGGGTAFNRVEKYTPATDTWTILPDDNCNPVYGHASLYLGNNIVLKVGGNDTTNSTNKVSKYNIQNGSCEIVGNLNIDRQGIVIWREGNDVKVNVGYSTQSGTYIQNQEIFSLITNTSTLLGPNPNNARSLLGGGIDDAGKGRVFGGNTNTGFPTNLHEKFDPNPPSPSPTPTKTVTNTPVVSPSPTKTPEPASPTPTTPKNPVTPQPNNLYLPAISVNKS